MHETHLRKYKREKSGERISLERTTHIGAHRNNAESERVERSYQGTYPLKLRLPHKTITASSVSLIKSRAPNALAFD